MQKFLYLSLSLMLAATGASTAYAVDNGGGGNNNGGNNTGGQNNSSGGGDGRRVEKPKLSCKKGEVVKKVKRFGVFVNKCVTLEFGILPDEDLYQQGRVLAKTGEYEWALQVLATITNQNDPRVLNMIGYSNRKAGRLEIGITYYHKALAINPDLVIAREYLGEGYVAAGRIDLAQIQLAEIKNRAGVDSNEFKLLSEAIAMAIN